MGIARCARLRDAAFVSIYRLAFLFVVSGSGSTHPSGKPINISTHAGESAAPTAAVPSVIATMLSMFGNRSPAFSCASGVIVAHTAEHERGVGQADPASFTATASGVPAPFPLWCFSFRSAARASHSCGSSESFGIIAAGVGHSACVRSLCCVSGIVSPDAHLRAHSADPFRPASSTVGVFHIASPRDDEESLASVWRPDIGSADIEPDRIIPRFGKASENGVQSPRSERCDVLHDDDSGS